MTKSRSVGFDKIVFNTAKGEACDAGSAVEGAWAKAVLASETNATEATALRRVRAIGDMISPLLIVTDDLAHACEAYGAKAAAVVPLLLSFQDPKVVTSDG